jgi:hypothetical protein
VVLSRKKWSEDFFLSRGWNEGTREAKKEEQIHPPACRRPWVGSLMRERRKSTGHSAAANSGAGRLWLQNSRHRYSGPGLMRRRIPTCKRGPCPPAAGKQGFEPFLFHQSVLSEASHMNSPPRSSSPLGCLGFKLCPARSSFLNAPSERFQIG